MLTVSWSTVGPSFSFQPLCRFNRKSDTKLILPFQSDKNGSCVDPLDYMLLPTPPPMDEEGIWRLERKYSRGRGRGSYKAFMIWKVRARCIKYFVQDPSLGSYTVSIGNCIR